MRTHNHQPTAQQPRRVPRTRVDALWVAGEPVSAVRFITGIVASIDGPDTITCTITDGELVAGILVLGELPEVGETVEIEIRGDLFIVNRSVEVDGYTDTIQDAYDTANAAAAAAEEAANTADNAMQAANGKNSVTYSLNPPGTAANTPGDIWFRKEAATQTIIGQWQGIGGNQWQQVTLNNQVIANLDAGKLTAGSAFTNALWVKTNFTLGDAAVDGVIQTHDFANQPVGVFINKNGLVAKGGTITGATIQGSRVVADGVTWDAVMETYSSAGVFSLYKNTTAKARLWGTTVGSVDQCMFTMGSQNVTLYDDHILIGSSGPLYLSAPNTYLQSGPLHLSQGLNVTGRVNVTNGGAALTGQPNVRWNGTSNYGDLRYTSWTHPATADATTDMAPLELTAEQMYGWGPVTYRLVEPAADRPADFVFWGARVEELTDRGFEPLVYRDEAGEPNEIDYAKLCLVQQAALRDLNARVEELAERVADLEAAS